MKRTIIAVISMVLILFAFSACRPTNIVGIPIDPTPDTPVTPPSGPSIPDYTIQVGDKTYQYLDDAIEAAPNGAIVEIGSGEFRIGSSIAITKNLTITGAGIDKTTITVSGDSAFAVTGDSFKISNLTIAEESSDVTVFRGVISIESKEAEIDSVKITGNYSSSVNNFKIVGITTNENTESVTITNSRFEGFRVPVEIDNDFANGEFTALIKGNTFDTYDKVTFEYRNSDVTIEDNTFVLDSDTDKSFQISLDWKNGTITPEQAKAVAKANDCVVQVLRTGLIYDAEGFVISDLEGLKSFASGKAGSIAKLIAPIKVTESITFIAEANNLSLNGNGNEITVDIAGSTSSSPAVAFHIYGSSVTFDDVDIAVDAGCINVIVPYSTGFTYDGGTITGKIDNDSWSVNMGINPAADSKGTIIRNASFVETYTPVYAESADFCLENVGFSSGIEIVNYSDETELVDCYPIDGTYMTSFNIHDDIPYTEAMEISRQNNNCIVIPDRNGTQIKYNSKGMVITTPENLKAAFDKSLSVDETINATIIAPITVESSFIAQQGSSNLHITANGEGGITISSPINLTSVTGLAFEDVSFTVGSNTNQAFIINTGSDVAFSGCTFTKEGDSPSGVAISVNGDAGNIKVTDCIFNNFVTTIYSDLNRGEITGNTINGYGGIYILSNNSIANNATEPINYPDLKVSGNKAGYDISSYDHTATDTAWDNTLRFAVTDATTALSDAVKRFASDLKTANPDMNVAVIYEGEYPNIPVLWANNEDYSQGK